MSSAGGLAAIETVTVSGDDGICADFIADSPAEAAPLHQNGHVHISRYQLLVN